MARHESGIGILEAIVALAIAALALSALYRTEGMALRATSKVRMQDMALQYARAHLDALGGEGTLLSGESTGTYARGLNWRLNIAPLAKKEASNAAGDKPYWIRLEAIDSRGRQVVQLETAKLARESQ